jgi:hypothetical protein
MPARPLLLSAVAPFVLLALLIPASPSLAGPTLGFIEDWPDSGNVGTWQGGIRYRNPGHDGFGGANDGYLVVSNLEPFQSNHCGTVSFGPEYHGDWIAAGVTRIELQLRDVNTNEALEIHLGIGNGITFWTSNQGFLPPENGWGAFGVNLSSVEFTKIMDFNDTTSFATTLHNVDRINIRHDLAPLVKTPDPILADFGVDHLVLTSAPLSVAPPPLAVSQPVEMRPPYPNPSRGPVMLPISSPESGPVRIEVVDLAGRRLFHGELPAGAAGERLFMWNGLDDRGRSLAPGRYRVRAVGKGGGVSRPIVRVR